MSKKVVLRGVHRKTGGAGTWSHSLPWNSGNLNLVNWSLALAPLASFASKQIYNMEVVPPVAMLSAQSGNLGMGTKEASIHPCLIK